MQKVPWEKHILLENKAHTSCLDMWWWWEVHSDEKY